MIKIMKLSYQRNGICGYGFFTALIHLKEDGLDLDLLATFEAKEEPKEKVIQERTRVVNPKDITSGWRGDNIGGDIQNKLEKLMKRYKVKRFYDLIEKLNKKVM